RHPRAPLLRDGPRRAALDLLADRARAANRARARGGARDRPRCVRLRRARAPRGLDGADALMATGWDELPVVVTVAPTGAEVTRADNPALPHTPNEIAADVIACAEEGAAVCHLHVREEDGSPSSRPELFAEAIERIRERSPIITMVSTGGAVWMPMEERMTGLEAGPDLAGVETGSMNFGEDPFVTVPADARRVIERAGEQGIGVEAEMFDVGHVVAGVRMLERGELPAPLRANHVFGVPGGIDATPEALAAMLRPLQPETHWSVTA